MTQVVSESEPKSTQRLQGLLVLKSRRIVGVLSLNVDGLAQYKLPTVVKLTHELPALVILLQEVGQKGIERLKKAKENVSQNGK
eukprot:snap_masked-scaffold_9-processed-gene-11.26-mRNA-1 protein AED:1.00 eAED:1.00 QI:0/-1/0/0/-1/1/1/0/83